MHRRTGTGDAITGEQSTGDAITGEQSTGGKGKQ
jgi:hypothetical protein